MAARVEADRRETRVAGRERDASRTVTAMTTEVLLRDGLTTEKCRKQSRMTNGRPVVLLEDLNLSSSRAEGRRALYLNAKNAGGVISCQTEFPLQDGNIASM